MALNWKYALGGPFKRDDGSIKNISLRVDDWIHLIDENTVLNRSALKNPGLNVGEATLYFDKTQS
ncbi:MAG: hypothetical protein ACI93R_000871 [Flavobacteriales bacterium]|jgi:hypothetical protein